MNLRTPWNQTTFVAFDTETSGKYPLLAEVCEIAAVKWRGGKVVETFQTFCKTRLPMSQQVIDIHKITNEMIASAPGIGEVLPGFAAFIEGAVLVAHHAPFDLGFMALEFEGRRLPLPSNPVVCTSLLSQEVFPRLMNHRLATLVGHFGIHQAQAHRALDDSRACLEVALRCFEQVGQGPGGGQGQGRVATLEEIFAAQGGALRWESYSVKDLEAKEPSASVVAAARGQLVMEITYKGGSQPGVPRRVTALGLVRNPSGDYFVGLCHRENAEKRFFLDKLATAKILD